MWKTIGIILDNCIGKDIKFQDVPHGFQSNRVTVTAYLKVNPLEHMASMREAFQENICLDIHKDYEWMDW